MKEEEKVLIEKAKTGDKEAFSKLYSNYYRLIRYIIYDAVKDDDLTLDLLSTVFEKAYTRINSFVNHISFEAWLKTIAINTVIDFIRSNKDRQYEISLDDETKVVQVIEDNDPETDFIKSESHIILHQAISQLRTRYRNLIELRYFHNLSYKELSERLNIPMGTIKSDLNKARHKLREIFQNISNNSES